MVRRWNDMVSKSIGSLIICVFRKYIDWMAANVKTFFLHEASRVLKTALRVMERTLALFARNRLDF